MRTRTKIIASLAVAGALVGLGEHVTRRTDAPDRSAVLAAHDRAAPPAAAGPTPALAVAARIDVTGVLRAIAEAQGPEREKLAQDAHFTLVGALRDDPAAATAALEQYLATAGGRDTGARVAVGALVAVGAPPMQDALVRLVETRAGDADFVRLAMPSIGFLAQPTVRTETALRTLADTGEPGARATARLAVGIMAGKLAVDEPARASAIVDGYAARLAEARTADERGAYLDALGNAATAGAGAAIATQLADPDPALRKRAALALRRVETGAAEAALLGTLVDTDERVRESAAWSLAYRAPSAGALRAMLDRLAHEPSDRVVSSLLDTVWARRATDRDAVAAAIRGLASGHRSESIRARAAALL